MAALMGSARINRASFMIVAQSKFDAAENISEGPFKSSMYSYTRHVQGVGLGVGKGVVRYANRLFDMQAAHVAGFES